MSWRIDATDSKGQGHWRALSRAVDPHGQPLDVLRPAHRDPEATRRLLQKAIRRNGLPETITMDGSAANEAVINRSHEAHGTPISIRQVQDFNTIVEQAHRAVKRVTRLMVGVKAFEAAQDTLGGSERMHMIKKTQRLGGTGDAGLTAAEQGDALAAASPHRQGALAPHNILIKICDTA